MTTVLTSYTEKANKNTLCGAPLSKYRLVHWMVDLLKNFIADPINLRDERIARALKIQDGRGIDDCKGLFVVDVPYNTDTRKAANTPSIMVSAGESQYPIQPVNYGIGAASGAINARHMYERTVSKAIGLQIAIITESCDGTMLLADIIEDFLMRFEKQFPGDGMVQQFALQGSSATKRIAIGEAQNAKDNYQMVINAIVRGALTWTADTQGPVFRGIQNAP